MQLDLGTAHFFTGIQVGQLALLDAAYRAFQQLGIEAEADLGHLPALVLAKQFTGAADFQIVVARVKPAPSSSIEAIASRRFSASGVIARRSGVIR